MSLRLLLFLLLIGLASVAWSQNLGGGLVIGGNISQIDGDTDGGFRQAGLVIGGFVNYPLGPNWYLQPEILYDQLGSRQRQGFFVIRSHHISVPILISTQINLQLGGQNQTISLEAGPVIGILLGASERLSGQDQTDLFRQPDLRAVAGGSYRFSERLSFSVRYGYSILSFLRNNPANTFPLDPTRGGLFHHYIHVGLRLHLIDR